MRLDITELMGKGFKEVTASHNGESIIWQVKTYGKVRPINPAGIFDEINAYWEWAGPDVQQQVWDGYKKIKAYLDDAMDILHINKVIGRHVTNMYAAMPMESFQRWLMSHGNPYVPPDTKRQLEENEAHANPVSTYLVGEYLELTALSLATRPMLPIWGEYIEQVSQTDTVDRYKEMEALALVDNTDMVTWPEPHSAMDKLEEYIKHYADKDPVSLASLWRGIGSVEIPRWLLASVMVRRLTIVPLCDHQAAHNIIANVYSYVSSKLAPSERRTSDKVVEKRRDSEGRDEDDKTSMLEEFKVKQRISDGDAIMFENATLNMMAIAMRIDPSFDKSLLEITAKRLPRIQNVGIHPHQKLLCQWVLARGYSPRAISYIPKVAVDRLLVTAQALLWHWGYLNLACFMLVDHISTSSEDVPGLTYNPRSNSRITAKDREALAGHYPHEKRQRPNQPNINLATVAVGHVTRAIMTCNWQFYGPKELHKLAGQPGGRSLLVVPNNIKSQITDLVIHLAQLNRD